MSLVNHFKLMGYYIKNIANNPKENLNNIKNVSIHMIKHIWSNSPKNIFLKTGEEIITPKEVGQKKETNIIGGTSNKKINRKTNKKFNRRNNRKLVKTNKKLVKTNKNLPFSMKKFHKYKQSK